jgi:hypothetical protein
MSCIYMYLDIIKSVRFLIVCVDSFLYLIMAMHKSFNNASIVILFKKKSKITFLYRKSDYYLFNIYF